MEIKDDLLKDWVPLHPALYRPGTIAKKQRFNFLLVRGGIGDYICWSSAILYVLEIHTHVQVVLWTQSHFEPVARKLFGRFKDRVEFRDAATVDQVPPEELNPAFFPLDTPNGIGMNLIDLGFVYYTSVTPFGKYREHIRLNVSDVDISKFNLPERYVVVTTGYTSPTRVWKSSAINGVVDYLNSIGVVPVFLGKEMIYDKTEVKYTAKFEEGIDFRKGIDLRNETDLLQCARIISGARLVCGLDNGLLHLGGTQSTPIIMGLSTALPMDRQIRRPKVSAEDWPKNEVTYITPDPKELPCVGCQSKMRYHANQDFAYCYYKDYKCLDKLADPEPWIKAMKRYLEVG